MKLKKGYCAPLEGKISAIMSLLQGCMSISAKMVNSLTPQPGSPAPNNNPTMNAGPASQGPKGSQFSPTNKMSAPRPRDME